MRKKGKKKPIFQTHTTGTNSFVCFLLFIQTKIKLPWFGNTIKYQAQCKIYVYKMFIFFNALFGPKAKREKHLVGFDLFY